MSTSTRLYRGLPVVDAAMPMVIKVTGSDLKNGYTRLPNYCVVAHAVKRQEHREAEINRTTAFVMHPDKTKWVRYRVPTSLQFEIRAHDRGGEFKGGEYRLTPVSPSIRFSAGPRASRKPTARKRPLHITEDIRDRAHYGKESA